jgi:hypothetical protein
MRLRLLTLGLLSAALPLPLGGQEPPKLAKIPTATDTTLSRTAQAASGTFERVALYVCTSTSRPSSPPPDCSTGSTPEMKRLSLPNLGDAPLIVTSSGGKFSIVMSSALLKGSYVWISEVTTNRTDHTKKTTTSPAVRVPVPLLTKASLSVSGTESASRDVGGKVQLDLDHGHQNAGWGETEFTSNVSYDDKWKHTALSSNVTENYSGHLSQLRLFRPSTAFVPYGGAYRNNTQGIRVEQTYGAGLAHGMGLAKGVSCQLGAALEGILDNLYSPGTSTKLVGLHLSADLNYQFGNKASIEFKPEGTPVFNQSRAWSAAGDFTIQFPISKRWSFQFETVDNYYEIAPRTFNKNFLQPSIGISFK